ncbi:DUF1697 domain-containing protein [Aurantiacibacter poecillastricola]|uniref:DUF1697 domain-containing protein n=1 Tax=Aurantiacibacter poecillastricola TaxID=3064385 RepID=UPI00273D33CA|nr:DUF1697 domain-containing protein [Aurantiacibacter sp. 219JJ12-13]MDP5262993.1 DUF1697 domain-containing protein [Aurantiacibacter sp. 219JJ12-13]
MARCVALLGSINVGGNRVKMADLRKAFERAGFTNVATVTASGNVLFDDNSSANAGARIAGLLQEEFGIDSFAALRSAEELTAALAENPFAGTGEDKLVHTMFLETQPGGEAFSRLEVDHAGRGPEKVAPGTCALHIDYVEGAGNSKLTKPFIERRLGCRGTARNVTSIRRIIAAMEQ